MYGNTSRRTGSSVRVRASGKFFRLGESKWYLKGVSYGPFAPNEAGEFLPEEEQVRHDFAHLGDLGATVVRLYHSPPDWLLDAALEHDLRVLIDVPWDKHRCFFEDWSALQIARRRVRDVAGSSGRHPAVFAISVVNEIPNDIVRFYGHHRVTRFVDELLDIVHQQAPDCLATFANFPTTEFLEATEQDFCCFNVYLHDPQTLGQYLDRLQHIAGELPLVLGEYGIDSLRHGEGDQARMLGDHLQEVFRHGLAGSVVFSYTDDWFTGGEHIEDWAFGITRRDRSEKEAARSVRKIWNQVPYGSFSENLPSASVVVCSYNGSSTLRGCLRSLMRLNYPDYEVILVDDGSTDCTPEIAAEFPQVTCIRQQNCGLSVARNTGLENARGEIVAYTDSDCEADEDWLLYLVQGIIDQDVAAIGGPNITPLSDNLIAKCVAASPGNPSHVMLDDRYAEHVPGCNMAYRREVLVSLGGFDPQFRQAGDDVDLCWRLLDTGETIGYADGAMVWHHRRCTVAAYFRQQMGYGRAEALIRFKHPHRFGLLGRPSFHGIIYGDGAVGLPLNPPRVYHGRFGSAPFQCIYRGNHYSLRAWLTAPEWHATAVLFLVLAVLVPWLVTVPAILWSASGWAAFVSARQARLPKGAPVWCRPLIFGLHLAQPLLRGWQRYAERLRTKQLPQPSSIRGVSPAAIQCTSSSEWDLYWDSRTGRGREHLLPALVTEAERLNWRGDFDCHWVPWDAELYGTWWHDIFVITATEELGGLRRFTRARWSVATTGLSRAAVLVVAVWSSLALVTQTVWGLGAGAAGGSLVLAVLLRSRRRSLKATGTLLKRAAVAAGLTEAPARANTTEELEYEPTSWELADADVTAV